VQLAKDIWAGAIVPVPAAQIVRRGTLDGLPMQFLPDQGPFRYLADPFGWWEGDRLHVFAEHFDYRTAKGTIRYLTYTRDLKLVADGPALEEPWHLSYPLVFAAEGETWMMPEACASGTLTVYRAVRLPDRWEPAFRIDLPHVPIDATPLWLGGRWWLFHAAADPAADRLRALHVAHAERLRGPWTMHPMNPVRLDLGGARPGGLPVEVDGRLFLPVQDSRGTYGAALRLLEVTRLDPDRFEATEGPHLTSPPEAAPYRAGLHTLSAAGPVTLIDVKRRVLSPTGILMRPRRDLRRMFAGLRR
jgi:hypothetical protein